VTFRKLNILHISDYDDNAVINMAVKRLETDDISIEFGTTKSILEEDADIYIVGIDKIDNQVYEDLKKKSERLSVKYIFYTKSEDIRVATTFSRQNLTNLFLIPFELQKFKSYLEESVKGFEKPTVIKNTSETDVRNTIIGSSQIMMEKIRIAEKIAASPSVNVLITGETGTGKGLIAKLIHETGPNKLDPFLDINCSAIPINLLESELFGYEKGAFTDARTQKIGLFELAGNGTIFLDEIGDLDFEVQAKLLRAIDNRIIRRLGGIEDIPVKARIIAATNRNLLKLVKENKFREDLYHRLSVITIEVPPLSERGEDVLEIAEHYIRATASALDKKSPRLTDEVREFIKLYSWPGNIRELKNAVERSLLLLDGNMIQKKDFFVDYSKKVKELELAKSRTKNISLEIDPESTELQAVIKEYCKTILEKFDNNKSKTASFLNISRPRLDRILNDTEK